MNHLSHFFDTQLLWHPSRLNCLFQIIMGVIQSRNVQSQRIAAHFNDDTSIEGRIQKIYRFFRYQEFDYAVIARIILTNLNLFEAPLDLILDRTNWFFGNKNINYLVLAVRVHGYGVVPLLWILLPKKGNSNTAERINLLDKLFEIFPNLTINSLTGDREFIGKKWTKYVMYKNIPFYFRIKQNRLVECFGEQVHIGSLFENLKMGDEPQRIEKFIDGYPLYLAVTRSIDNELVIVMTNQDITAKEILEIYKTRWGIECLFRNIKKIGFNLEDTHMTDPKKLAKLMAVCALASVLCIKAGVAKHNIRPIKYKKTVKSYEYSFFQYGFNHIRAFLNKITGIFVYEKQNSPKKILGFNQLMFLSG